MAANKTVQNDGSVRSFLDAIPDRQKKREARRLATLMRRLTGHRARMWGDSIVGFGKYHYRYASGREGDWALVGFSPRKQNLAVYIMPGFEPFAALMKKLGNYKTGKSCLYIKTLADVDETVLEKLILGSVQLMRERYPAE
jgi:hypothetical protein